MQLHENIMRVRQSIQEASEGRAVMLLPVTKTQPPEVINLLIQEGFTDIGENRVQEYKSKKDKISEKFAIHMIGQLQSNKVRGIIEDVKLIHSVDRIRLAQEIDRQAKSLHLVVDILVQVNIAREPQKAGILIEELPALIDCIGKLGSVRLRGLMTIAPFHKDPQMSRPVFAQARRLFEDMQQFPTIDILSMGMSHDGLVAIQEGSTMVRYGSALFGTRP